MKPSWLLGVVTAFWLTMNFLLWRTTARGGGGAAVPLATVVQRVLEAADTSRLTIRQGGDVLGQLRWTPAVLQDAASANRPLADDGLVTRRTGYAVDLDLTLGGGAKELRGRGAGRLELEADRTWRSFEFRWVQRPLIYEFSAHAADGILRLRVVQGAEEVLAQSLPLRDPAALLSALDGTLGGFGLLSPGLLAGLGLSGWPAATGGAATNSPNPDPAAAISGNLLRVDSRTAELSLRGQRVRTFRLTGRLLDRYSGDVWIGRGGELLQVNLPGGVELRDATLTEAR